jgi:dTDP-4-dehydrorhamnose 3,5-epimerase
MPFTPTSIPGLLIFEPPVYSDSRGYFFESFNTKVFEEAGITTPFVQDNQSRSVKGVLRGLHYQLAPMAQSKLVRVVTGEVLDVAVDIRQGSPTYLQHFSIVLSAENKKQLYIPRGFAHGFVVLSDVAEFVYKCDNFYSKEHDAGIRFNDPSLAIDWQIDLSTAIISEKDQNLPLLAGSLNNFHFSDYKMGQ